MWEGHCDGSTLKQASNRTAHKAASTGVCAPAQPRQKWKTRLTIGDVAEALRPGIRVVGTAHSRPAVSGAVAVAKGGGAVAKHRVKHAVDAVGNFIGVAGHGGRRVGLCGGRRAAAVALLCTPRGGGAGLACQGADGKHASRMPRQPFTTASGQLKAAACLPAAGQLQSVTSTAVSGPSLTCGVVAALLHHNLLGARVAATHLRAEGRR